MPLSDEEKQRIREEEVERLKARAEYSRGNTQKTVLFWTIFMGLSVLLYFVVRVGH